MGTSIKRSSANTEFYTRGDVIPGIKIDGMDVIAAREGLKWAAEYCRAGNGKNRYADLPLI
jgi:pyruvate dehydrogenase E1 component alpha subunit